MRHHYVIHEDTGARYCKDGKWRLFAQFGTYSSCVQIWKKEGFALRKMRQLNRFATVAYVLSLPDHHYMDASGNIYDSNDNDRHIGNSRPQVHIG